MNSRDDHTRLLAVLAERAESLRTSEGWRAWLDTAGRFHTYSLRNQLLIVAQHPTATQVAGYRTWQSVGRQVSKGERGIRILAPCRRTIENTQTGEKTSILSGFRFVSVFDVTQTTGEPLPTLAMPEVTDLTNEGLFDRLVSVAISSGFGVEMVEHNDQSARGRFTPSTKQITIVSVPSKASRVRTLLHEMSHAFDFGLGESEFVTRADRELIAESSAFIVGTTLGLGMEDASTHYVASWGGEPDSLQRIAERILQVVNAVTNAIDLSEPSSVAA